MTHTRPIVWLSISAYATKYSVSRGTVYKWLEAGLIQTYRVGRLIRLKDEPPTHEGSAARPD